jgi:ComF family protein
MRLAASWLLKIKLLLLFYKQIMLTFCGMNFSRTYLADFLSLIFPQLCNSCKCNLTRQEKLICTECIYHLPYTDFHQHTDHIVAQQFWGKIELEASYALLYFNKGTNVQHLLHNFKYRNVPQIGNTLGNMAGLRLLNHDKFKTVDLIIPVPLHPSRLRKRGYNQSTRFAAGLAEKLDALVTEHNLVRARATATQTRKSRFARFENMRSAFAIKNPDALKDKHILLVDDIMTTGSTLEACAQKLLGIDGVRLSIATIAYAE